LFVRDDHSSLSGGGAAPLPRTLPALTAASPLMAVRRRLAGIDFAPDLGARIGSAEWFRGAATCVGLCALTWLLAPGLETKVYAAVPAPLADADLDAARALAIAPLARGAATGRRIAATRLVTPLSDTPERPVMHLDDVKLASGTSLLSVLQRSGVGEGDASQVGALVTRAMALDEIQPGTLLDLTLGRRPAKAQPRPLENLSFRARFDLKLEVARTGGALSLRQVPIAIDHTPLRIQGTVGSSLYRSARAAGAPAKAVEAYIKTLASRMPVSRLGADCRFDIILGQARAATGEVQLGKLMFAGVSGCSSRLQLAPWESDGKTEWFDGSGRGNRSGMMGMPVNGRFSSAFGMRRHPILGYVRMHRGIDIAAPYGSPVYAAVDGVVQVAGRSAGYGNLVKLAHDGGFGTGYGHLSRIYVRPGQRVRKGQQIGAVGNTGLSTGPHLHYELYRGGAAVNPRSVSFSSVRQLDRGDMGAFQARLRQLLATPVGHGAVKDED
jgi:murein DD-endopeptidase MepM/ murein hydrolase activator NlpD